MHRTYLCNGQKNRSYKGNVMMSKKQVLYKRQTSLMTEPLPISASQLEKYNLRLPLVTCCWQSLTIKSDHQLRHQRGEIDNLKRICIYY
jgi:hypothetical protein